MFDIGFYEVLVFAVVTLIFVGPKELPVLMRTVGRYVGILRRQADEFRGHFDAAMQEAEIDQMQAELESVSKEMDRSLDTASSPLDEDAPDPLHSDPLGIDAGAASDFKSQTASTRATHTQDTDTCKLRTPDADKGDA